MRLGLTLLLRRWMSSSWICFLIFLRALYCVVVVVVLLIAKYEMKVGSVCYLSILVFSFQFFSHNNISGIVFVFVFVFVFVKIY